MPNIIQELRNIVAGVESFYLGFNPHKNEPGVFCRFHCQIRLQAAVLNFQEEGEIKRYGSKNSADDSGELVSGLFILRKMKNLDRQWRDSDDKAYSSFTSPEDRIIYYNWFAYLWNKAFELPIR